MSRGTGFRAPLLWFHRWVGLTVGLLFTIACVSGSALYFQPQFWEWAHGELTPAGIDPTPGSLDRWLANGQAAVPDLGRPIALWPPHTEHNLSDAGMLIYGFRNPGGFGNTGFVAVLVDPPTGDLLGVVDVDRSWAFAPLFFHRNFWGGEVGSIVMGTMAVGSLFLIVAGLYLWWPAAGKLGRKLSGRPLRLTMTRARPMHDWVGIWSLPVLLVVTFTGLYIARPAWVDPALTVVAGPAVEEAAPAAACTSPITLEEAAARGAALTGTAGFRSIYQTADEGVWEITYPGNVSTALHDETHVVADLGCGTVLVEATPQNRNAHEATVLWMYGLHDGTAFGPVGVVVVALLGATPLILMISGVLLWLRGRRVPARIRESVPARPLPPLSAESSTQP